MDNVLMKKKVLNIDKSTWKLTKLGELMDDISERVDNPAQSGYERFVGLEHFVSGDIKIRNWGTTENLTSSTKAFKAGDILFARRNAYLRRASLVDFDGCCSGDAFVLRENHEKVVPGFLAFFFNSNAVWDFANENAAGTMSQRVKWRDLANYEFLLPPKEQQAQLAELLWAMDEVIEREGKLIETVKISEEVKLKDIFLSEGVLGTKESKLGPIDRNWRCVKLEDLLEDQSIISHLDGNHGSFYPRNEEFVSDGVPYISANCIEDDGISLINAKYLTEDRANTITKGIAKDGDILLAHNATVGPVCILRTNFERVILSTSLTYYRVDPLKINSLFLFYFMKSRLFQSQLERVMSQSTRNQVPITTQRTLYFIIPPIKIQDELIEQLATISDTGKVVELKIARSKALQKALINQIF